MSTVKAISFKNTAELAKELRDLKSMEAREYAVIAKFEAVEENGKTIELSCFIERLGNEFGIMEVISENNLVIDLANLQLDLMQHKISMNMC